jgi:hypothetical protein
MRADEQADKHNPSRRSFYVLTQRTHTHTINSDDTCQISGGINVQVDVGRLGSDAVWACKETQTFRRDTLPQSSVQPVTALTFMRQTSTISPPWAPEVSYERVLRQPGSRTFRNVAQRVIRRSPPNIKRVHPAAGRTKTIGSFGKPWWRWKATFTQMTAATAAVSTDAFSASHLQAAGYSARTSTAVVYEMRPSTAALVLGKLLHRICSQRINFPATCAMHDARVTLWSIPRRTRCNTQLILHRIQTVLKTAFAPASF